MKEAIASMTLLNRKAAEISHHYEIHACTDVTGFGFLGHLSEMINEQISAEIDSISIPVIKGAIHCAEEFLLTAAAQRNRNHVKERVEFASKIPFSMEELLFDPQTSGGLLFAVRGDQAGEFLKELKEAGLPGSYCGKTDIKKRKRYLCEIGGYKMITVNAIGDACPIPVVKTRKAMETIKGSEVVETLVDNEIAVENLKKMAGQMGYQVKDQKLEEGKYSVQIMVTEAEKNRKNTGGHL